MAFSFISDLWNKWNIRGFVILSLSLQVILILFAPLRKKTANRPIIFLLWSAYLMADSVAAFAVGLISHKQGNSNTHVVEVDGALQAFWTSFLLLHLGGPDTITAFSLEDSSLWRRHLLSLIFQVSAAIYVFMRIFPSDKSLVIPTILVFLAGFIKIAERTLALYLSSFPKLRESMLLDNELTKIVDSSQNQPNDGGDENGCFDEEGPKLAESIVVKNAYSFFQIFNVFIVDLIYTKNQREVSMCYFDKVSAVDALRVISAELNFIYEVLHTKALTIRHKVSYIFRIIALTSIVVALGLFNRWKKYQLPKLDVKITHILLFGGIIIDGISLFRLVFSDWTIAGINYTTTGSAKLDAFLHKLLSIVDNLRKPQYVTFDVEPYTNYTYKVLHTPFIFRRWSESISACSLFSEVLKESPRRIFKRNQFWGIVILKIICSFPFRMVDKIISCFLQARETITRCCGKRSMIGNAKYVSKNPLVKRLWINIFEEVKKLRDSNRVTKQVKSDQSLPGQLPTNPKEVSEHFTKANMHNGIIKWHIATEIWYHKEKKAMSSPTIPQPAQIDRMEFSKILSDYMLYLLLNQPDLMSAVAMVGIAQKTWAETLREIQHRIGDATKDLSGVCEKLYSGVPDNGPPNHLKSPLDEGLELVRQLGEKRHRKWEITSIMWHWLLQYAAINIKGETHMQVLSKGGELVTLVWLLMAHLGCFYKPEWGKYREHWNEERSATRERHAREQST